MLPKKRIWLLIERLGNKPRGTLRNCGNKQPSPEIIVRAIERAHGIGA